MRRLYLKLRRRRRLHADLQEELAFHREQARAHGGHIPFGNAARITDESLDLWRFTTVENLWRDVVYAARGLARSRGLVVSAMVSLGLGIGVNTSVFAIAVELLLSQPSVTAPRSIVTARIGGGSHVKQEVFDLVRESEVFRELVGQREEHFVNWDDGERTRRLFAIATTKNFFTAFGVPVAQGRGILPGDAAHVVVVRHEFWRTQLGSDPRAIGQAITLDGQPYTILGILPPQHRTLIGFGFSPDMYVPVAARDTMLKMYGRLQDGTSVSETRQRLQAAAARVDAVFPSEHPYAADVDVEPIGGLPRMKGAVMTIGLFFVLLLSVVALVLLMACVNVAGLLLARAATRRRELAIRLSLGASRSRLLQQLLVESALLALIGAGTGIIFASGVTTAVSRLQLSLPVPLQLHVAMDWRVAGYAALVTVAAALATGLVPAWQACREAIAPALRERKLHLRRVLIAAQVAIAVVVLATAVLFLRNLFASHSMSPGFDVHRTLRAEVNLPESSYTTAEQIQGYVDRTLTGIAALPAVEAAAAAHILPFIDNTNFGTPIAFADGTTIEARFHWNAVTPGFFRVLDIPLIRGRDFTAADRGGERVVIVNRVFATRYLGSRDPIGRVFLWGADGRPPYRIVGMVGNTKTTTIGEEDQPQLYEPLSQVQSERRRLQFVARTHTPPARHVEPMRALLHRLEPAAGTEVATLQSSIGLAFLPSQAGAVLMGTMGALGLVLAAVGLYGMTAYVVARRAPEMGVRLALGATPRAMTMLVLWDAVRVVAIGSLVGIAGALAVTRLLGVFLVEGLGGSSALTLAIVLAVLMLTALVAAWGPSRAAARLDPMTTLRAE